MRFLKLIVAAALLVLAASPAAVLAAGPDHDHGLYSGTDPDFCGTGEPVDWVDRVAFNGWEDMAFGHRSTTLTNPANGAQVTDSFAGGGKILDFIDEGDAGYTVISERVGLPALLKVAHGPLLTLDAGLVIFADHFDADDNYLGAEIVAMAGPHPNLLGENDYCDLVISVLGL